MGSKHPVGSMAGDNLSFERSNQGQNPTSFQIMHHKHILRENSKTLYQIDLGGKESRKKPRLRPKIVV